MTLAVFLMTAQRVEDNPLRVAVSPKTPPARENVSAVEDAPVETKKIPVAVVSKRIFDADDSEKSSFS